MKYLSDYTEQAQNECFEKYGVFFAFSEKQFKEGCEKVGATKENKVASFGSGGYVLVKNRDLLIDELNHIHDKAINKDIAENGIVKIIHRELANYETQITGDIQEVTEILKDYKITEEQIKKEYKIFYKKCIKNDWF